MHSVEHFRVADRDKNVQVQRSIFEPIPIQNFERVKNWLLDLSVLIPNCWYDAIYTNIPNKGVVIMQDIQASLISVLHWQLSMRMDASKANSWPAYSKFEIKS